VEATDEWGAGATVGACVGACGNAREGQQKALIFQASVEGIEASGSSSRCQGWSGFLEYGAGRFWSPTGFFLVCCRRAERQIASKLVKS